MPKESPECRFATLATSKAVDTGYRFTVTVARYYVTLKVSTARVPLQGLVPFGAVATPRVITAIKRRAPLNSGFTNREGSRINESRCSNTRSSTQPHEFA